MDSKSHILVCDDDQTVHLALKHILKSRGRCTSVYNGDEAMAVIRSQKVDVAIVDVSMRTPTEGLDLIPKIRETDPDVEIIMNSGLTDLPLVRRALQAGAADYLSKDFEPAELELTLDRVLKHRALVRRTEQQGFEVASTQKRHVMIGDGAAMATLRRSIEKVARGTANVVIFGETGVGKEVVARLLRRTLPDGTLEPFVAVDSSTIQSTMAESLLFGHEKGAFTGAEKSNRGIFEEADGGTVYFDEIANMPLEIQAKLLRVLQEKEVVRLGSSRAIQLEFRVICATNQDLEEMIKAGKFKADLFQRLNVIPLKAPPLRERREDIPALIRHFAGNRKFTAEALELLGRYDWPGNVRELSNLVAYVLTMSEGEEIEIADLPPKVRDLARTSATSKASAAPKGQGLYEQVENFEREILRKAYEENAGNVSKMALELGVDRSHLYTKLKQHGLHVQKKA